MNFKLFSLTLLCVFISTLGSTVTYTKIGDILSFSTNYWVRSYTVNLATDFPEVYSHHVDPSWVVNRDGVNGVPSMTALTVYKGDYFVVLDENEDVIYISGGDTDNDRIRLSATGTPGVLLDEWDLVKTRTNADAIAEAQIADGDEDTFWSAAAPAQFLASDAQPACTELDPKREVEIAVATDFLFCDVWSSGSHAIAEARIRSLYLEVETKYAAVSCLILSPTYIETHCASAAADPWIPNVEQFCCDNTQWSSTQFLNTIRDIWDAPPRVSIPSDIHMLITGWENDYGVAGTARNGRICSSNGVSWAEMNWVPTLMVAHELGHNLNLEHDDATVSGYNIMNTGVNLRSEEFSDISATALRAFLLTDTTSCLTAVGPSPTPTPSLSPTPSRTPTNSPPPVTPSPTPSVTPSVSSSASASSSPSLSPSASVSSSSTPSISPTISTTPTPSISESASGTPSVSATPSGSYSATPSASLSASPSSSSVVSDTPTLSPSASASVSITVAVLTATPSTSTTPSASGMGITVTPSASSSTSAAPVTVTPSLTPSASSIGITVTPSSSASTTPAGVSVTPSSSYTPIPSPTIVIVTPPCTKTPCPSKSCATTASVTPSSSTTPGPLNENTYGPGLNYVSY